MTRSVRGFLALLAAGATLTLGAAPALAFKDEGLAATERHVPPLVDALILRPFGLMMTVTGAVVFAPTAPTGSSAYNLAAGGPIVHPAVDAVLLTPIAPHMLTNRPVVVPGSSEVRVQPMMNGSNEEVFVTFDGQSGHPLQIDDVVEIRRARQSLRLVRGPNRTYFDVLRQKLKWGER